MIKHYLKVALRSLMKYKTHSLISAVCLAIGIVVFSIIFLFVSDRMKTRVPEQEIRISLFSENDSKGVNFNLQDLEQLHIRAGHLLDSISVRAYFEQVTEAELICEAEPATPYQIHLSLVNPVFLKHSGMPLLYGDRLPQASDEIVVTSGFISRLPSETNILGCWLRCTSSAGATDYRIVNVVDDSRLPFGERVDAYFPLSFRTEVPFAVCTYRKPGQDLKLLNRQLSQIKWSHGGQVVYPYASKTDDSGNVMAYYLFLLLGSLVLVSALITFLKFTFQMFHTRQREIALRKSMGSGIWGMVVLLFSEIFWMLVFSGFLSFLLSELLIPQMKQWLGEEYVGWLSLDACYRTQLVLCGVVLFLCFLLAWIPIWKVWHHPLGQMIQTSRNRHRFRTALLVIQMAISVFFLGIVFVVQLTFQEMFGNRYKPLASEEENRIVQLPLTERLLQHLPQIRSELEKMPEIEELLSIGNPTFRALAPDFGTESYLRPDSSMVSIKSAIGDPAYFDFFHIPMQGTLVSSEAAGMVYVSEAFAELLHEDHQEGVVTIDGNTFQVAGVFSDLYGMPLSDGHLSLFFVSPQQNFLLIKIHSGNNLKLVQEQIERTLRNFVPETLPLELQMMTDLRKTPLSGLFFIRWCLWGVAVISILLVVLSVYSSIALDARSRQKEVAVRKINGATPYAIAMLFVRSYLLVYLSVFAVVYPLVRFLMIKLLESDQAYRAVFGWGWGITLFFVILFLLMLTLAWQIWKLMHVDPVEVLRKE